MGVKSGDKVMTRWHSHLCHCHDYISSLFHILQFPICQVLLPEYGGMQVKIDDKELFMFRSDVVHSPFIAIPGCAEFL
jgi:hypothetical protein